MPLNARDREFLNTVNRFRVYLLIMALAVFLYLAFSPPSEIQMTTAIVGLALCGVFWLTQRLLTFISLLDLELNRVVTTLKRVLPAEQQELLGDRPTR